MLWCMCVQADTASHTLSVFSIGHHQVGQLVTEEEQLDREEVECATHNSAANLIFLFIKCIPKSCRNATS